MILIRIIQVPLLISFLGIDEFGRWLVLSSLPTWLALANLGFGSVASNEMSMAVGKGDVLRAKEAYSTTIALLTTITGLGLPLIAIITPFIPWDDILKTTANRHIELSWAAGWLGASVLISFYGETFGGRIRAARKAHITMMLGAIRPWLDIAVLGTCLVFTTRFDVMAFALFTTTVISLVATWFISFRVLPVVFFSFDAVRSRNFGSLFKKGLAFQAFPFGNALLFQGNLMIVQLILGPASVALFGTARTLVRTVNQAMELVNQVIWPELSFLIGSSDLIKAARLHRLAVLLSVGLAVSACCVLLIGGPTIFRLWTHNELTLPTNLLFLFLLPIPFNALWFTSSVVLAASNQHEGLAGRYTIGSCLSVLLCWILTSHFGIGGAAISTILLDMILVPYVLKRSLEIVCETRKTFFTNIIPDIQIAIRLLPISKFVK